MRIITGPPGCGKSTFLFSIVHYCKLSGWIVFYLPDCKVLMFNEEEAEKAETVCRDILNKLLELNASIFEKAKVTHFEYTFKELIEKGIREEKCQECLLGLIYKLLNYTNGPKVLFAVDNWNRLLLNKKEPSNSIAETIAYWTSFRVRV